MDITMLDKIRGPQEGGLMQCLKWELVRMQGI